MSARRRFGLLAAGIALGVGVVVLPAMAAPDAVTPEAVPTVAPVESVAPVAGAAAEAAVAAGDAVAPVLPVEPAPVEAVGDAVHVPSTGDCGPGAYRIEPGTCEWHVEPTPEPTPDVGGAVYCDFDCVVDSTPIVGEDEPGWDCRTDGNGLCAVTVHGTVYVLDFRTGEFHERG